MFNIYIFLYLDSVHFIYHAIFFVYLLSIVFVGLRPIGPFSLPWPKPRIQHPGPLSHASRPNSLVSLSRACQQAIFPAYRSAEAAAQRPKACFSLFWRKPTCIERLAMLFAAPVKHVAPLCAQAPRFLSCRGTRTSGQHVTSSKPDQLPMSLPTTWPPCNRLLVTPTDQSLNDLQSQPTPRF